MTTKNARDEMLQAHAAMAMVLDAKIGHLSEWKAFRAIDRALIALESDAAAPKPSKGGSINIKPKPLALSPNLMTYVQLASRLLNEVKTPVTTAHLVDYIHGFKKFSDLDKAKINITSSMSKDDKFTSIAWNGGKAWWWANQPIPKLTPEMELESLLK